MSKAVAASLFAVRGPTRCPQRGQAYTGNGKDGIIEQKVLRLGPKISPRGADAGIRFVPVSAPLI